MQGSSELHLLCSAEIRTVELMGGCGWCTTCEPFPVSWVQLFCHSVKIFSSQPKNFGLFSFWFSSTSHCGEREGVRKWLRGSLLQIEATPQHSVSHLYRFKMKASKLTLHVLVLLPWGGQQKWEPSHFYLNKQNYLSQIQSFLQRKMVWFWVYRKQAEGLMSDQRWALCGTLTWETGWCFTLTAWFLPFLMM